MELASVFVQFVPSPKAHGGEMPLKRNVLIVDDKSLVLSFLKTGLSRYHDHLNVFTATNVEDALKLVDANRIDLITTDICMPGMDGFELISRSREKNPDTRFIVMTAYSCDEYCDKCKKLGVIDFIEKPFDWEQFAERMFQALEASRGVWGGKILGFHLTDALQLVEMGRRSQSLRVRTEFGEGGLIHLRNGEVCHAVLEDLEGEEAFYEIIALEGGEIESLPLPEDVPRTIERPLAALLLEGMRRKDEAAAARKRRMKKGTIMFGMEQTANQSPVLEMESVQQGSNPADGKPPPSTEVPQGPGPSQDGNFYRLLDEGFLLYRRGEHQAARERWEKALALRPHDRAVQFNLKKLAEKEKEEAGASSGPETSH